jgi:hypothetical protein
MLSLASRVEAKILIYTGKSIGVNLLCIFTASSREIGDEHGATKFLNERVTGQQKLDKQQKDIYKGLE